MFSLWEKERHSLQSRIRQKSSVEVLCCWTPLKGAESSTHCCGFFSVTSDKDFFFFLLWEARPAAPEPMQASEMRRLQLQVKKNQKKKPGISVLDILKTSSYRHNEIWSFVVSNKQCWVVYCGALSTPNFSSPSVLSEQLPSAVSEGRSLVRRTVRDHHPAVSTRALILWFLSVLITSLRWLKLLVNTLLKWEDMKGRRANLSQDPSLIWAPGRNRDTVSDSPHASAHLENCTDKPAALCYETSFLSR